MARGVRGEGGRGRIFQTYSCFMVFYFRWHHTINSLSHYASRCHPCSAIAVFLQTLTAIQDSSPPPLHKPTPSKHGERARLHPRTSLASIADEDKTDCVEAALSKRARGKLRSPLLTAHDTTIGSGNIASATPDKIRNVY